MDKYDIDYQASQELWKFSMENCRVAEQYAEIRNKYAGCIKFLKLSLAKSFSTNPELKKMAEDKAYLVLADKDKANRDALMESIEFRNQYKGLEKVMEARQAALSFNQSLIKKRSEEIVKYMEKKLFSIIYQTGTKRYYVADTYEELIERLGPEMEKITRIERHCAVKILINESEVIINE